MPFRTIILLLGMLFLTQASLWAQLSDTVFNLTAIIYDDLYIPVSATHVININTRQGDVTDSLGIFTLPVHAGDSLLVRNIAFRDTIVPVGVVHERHHIRLRRMIYPLKEARVFEWGASYEDFQEAFLGMDMQQSLGASLGLPRQDPEKVPLEMDEKAVKSAGLLLTSPVSFFYYNFSRHAKSARKAYWLEKNQEKHELFSAITGPENLSDITGLSGLELEEFQVFLYRRMVCDFKCSELDILHEIYGLWEVYLDLKKSGVLEETPR